MIESAETNPFFTNWETPFGVPPFGRIRPEHFRPAFERALAEQRREIARIADEEAPSFVNVIEAPSNEVIARISVELGSRGTIEMTTFPAIGVPTFIDMMRGGGSGSGG